MYPSIVSIGTANPEYKRDQGELAEFMVKHLDLDEAGANRLRALYRASGIKSRYSVIEDYGKGKDQFQFFPNNEALEPFPTVGERMSVFRKEAIEVSLKAVGDCLENSMIQKSEITHLITVSCTGMYAPGLDIDLVQEVGLNTTVQRTAINFMGCYAAFNALKVANNIVQNDPNANVLLVCVELCSLHFQKELDEENLMANALFGDGAAAALVSNDIGKNRSLQLLNFFSDLALGGKSEMGWYINDFGFEMKLSMKVPEVIRNGISKLTEELLQHVNIPVEDIEHFAIHPGGKRILQVIEEELGICKTKNLAAHEVLRDFGNMSSPTVLFTIKKIFESMDENNHGDHMLSFAFGPGLTLESMLLRYQESNG